MGRVQNQGVYLGVDQRAGAHRARLLRDIDRHVLHAPVAAQQFKLVQQLKLGVGGCASALLDPVAGGDDRLAAYDGDGGILSGKWSFEWNADLNLNELVLAVPEPAAFAAALGAFALVFALRGRAGR